jgi:polysaccharide export outer membrane protein
MAGTRTGLRWIGYAPLAALLVAGLGCFHTLPHQDGFASGPPPIAVPPPGTVPGELVKVTLPPYVIEAPDNLLIQVFRKARVPVDEDGKEAKDGKDKPTMEVAKPLPIQDISGSFQVRLDGSVGLGFWGSVPVSGLTLDQAADAIRLHLLNSESLQREKIVAQNLFVIVDVLAYNSKRYYVILDGGGYGEQVYPFPIYGSETVLDAIANVNGLHTVASKRNIWVARRTPHCGQPWQILPVDWIGITQHGITATNYQIMPGDRIYVKAQRIIAFDTALARIISPIERLMGVTLLGASTVNQIKGNVGNNNGF